MAKKAEYPKVVYNADGDWLRVNSAAEVPDGYYGHGEVPTTEEQKAQADAEAATARENAETAAKEHRAALRAFLDEHNVEYDGRIGTDKLETLAEQLREHLAANAEPPQPTITTPT